MKIIKHCILALIVAAVFIAASSSASAHHRRGPRGGFFFNTYPAYYDYGFYGPAYRPAPFSFGYYRGGPRRGVGIGISGRRFGFGFRSDRGRRRDRRDDRREEQREQREERRRND